MNRQVWVLLKTLRSGRHGNIVFSWSNSSACLLLAIGFWSWWGRMQPVGPWRWAQIEPSIGSQRCIQQSCQLTVQPTRTNPSIIIQANHSSLILSFASPATQATSVMAIWALLLLAGHLVAWLVDSHRYMIWNDRQPPSQLDRNLR